jgi:hypothetical protein
MKALHCNDAPVAGQALCFQVNCDCYHSSFEPEVVANIRDLIRRMSQANPLKRKRIGFGSWVQSPTLQSRYSWINYLGYSTHSVLKEVPD